MGRSRERLVLSSTTGFSWSLGRVAAEPPDVHRLDPASAERREDLVGIDQLPEDGAASTPVFPGFLLDALRGVPARCCLPMPLTAPEARAAMLCCSANGATSPPEPSSLRRCNNSTSRPRASKGGHWSRLMRCLTVRWLSLPLTADARSLLRLLRRRDVTLTEVTAHQVLELRPGRVSVMELAVVPEGAALARLGLPRVDDAPELHARVRRSPDQAEEAADKSARCSGWPEFRWRLFFEVCACSVGGMPCSELGFDSAAWTARTEETTWGSKRLDMA